MKKKVLSAVLAASLVMTFNIPAFATPNQEVIENQAKYDELTKKIDEITGKVVALNAEIEPLIETIENNKKQMEDIKVEVKNTEKEIETAKEEIQNTEKLLGKRIRELYKSGGQSSYLMLLFSAESFNDLVAKLDSTTRLVNIDKKVVNELKDKQTKLNDKIETLDEKSKEITKLNEQTQKSLADFEVKKVEQEKLAAEAKAEQAIFDKDFLTPSERGYVQNDISILLDPSTSIDGLKSAIGRLEGIRDAQIRSSIVIEEINQAIEAAEARIAELEAANNATNNVPNRGEASATGNAVVDFAYGYLGAPYVWGATGPSSFDCSGFTSFVFRNAAGIEITRTTYSQMTVGTPVSYSELQVGDLVFTYGGDHVGIYVGGGNYIHASQPGDVVKVSPVQSFYTARRVL